MTTGAQTTADQMKSVVRRMVDEGLNGGNLDVLDETHSTDAIWHGPGGKEIRGRDGIKEMMSGYQAAFPDMKMTVEHEVAEGDLLATHWRVVGTHDGPMGDIPATGKTVDIRGHVMTRFEDGKIVEEFEVFDELEMLKQLGIAEG